MGTKSLLDIEIKPLNSSYIDPLTCLEEAGLLIFVR